MVHNTLRMRFKMELTVRLKHFKLMMVASHFTYSFRLANEKTDKPRGGSGFRPLYDIPYMFDAREFLRKKLIGQTVQVTVDYIQPANNDFPEKSCCTVVIGGINVAEALVSKGLATVVRYSADNDQRSSKYDDLLAAEDKAIKSNKGTNIIVSLMRSDPKKYDDPKKS